jgi:LacI family transcriptional regulator
MRRVTQGDIARELGLHPSTVSKALKGDPAIAAATVARVRQAAGARGFRPDPMLTALARYRARRPTTRQATIGWIHNYPGGTDMSLYAGFADYFDGAAARCGELGYKLEPFWVDGKRLTDRSLPRILRARGIRGIIFAPQVATGVKLNFPVEDFCSVTIGYSLHEPKLDVITNDHFSTMTEIVERLRQQGYRRVGCYLWHQDNERMGRRARSAFLAYSNELAVCVRTYRHFRESDLSRWIRRNGLDAVIGRGAEQADALMRFNQRHPARIAFAGYAIEASETRFQGMCHNNHLIGARAAEWIAGKLEHGQSGLPAVPQRLLVAGSWVAAATG